MKPTTPIREKRESVKGFAVMWFGSIEKTGRFCEIPVIYATKAEAKARYGGEKITLIPAEITYKLPLPVKGKKV